MRTDTAFLSIVRALRVEALRARALPARRSSGEVREGGEAPLRRCFGLYGPDTWYWQNGRQ
jgi:hypothetical protein